MELVVEPINLIENTVTIAVADNVVPWAGFIIARIETPGPESLVAGKADDAVAV